MLFALFAAHAADVEVWSYDDFQDDEWVDGTDDWSAGYGEDPWYGYQGQDSSWAFSYTDRNTGDDEAAIDNYLTNPAESVGDGAFEATFYTQDDDALGLVIGQDGDAYYLFLLCGDVDGRDAPSCPVDLDGGAGSAIIYADRGDMTVLASDRGGYSLDREGSGYGDMRFGLNDGVLTATYDDGGVEMSVEVSGLDRINDVGFYAWDAGYEDGSWTGFTLPTLFASDDDDDGVIDDDDNCEFEPNEDQDDADNDGIGDACDDSADADTDTDADTDADADADTDTDADSDTDADTDADGGVNTPDGGGITAAGDCGCDAGGGMAFGLAPLLLAAALARRRSARG